MGSQDLSKYFLFHKLPEWKKGYRSPVYTMEFRAFRSNVPAWRKTASETIREMGLAPSESNVRMKNNVTIVEAGARVGAARLEQSEARH